MQDIHFNRIKTEELLVPWFDKKNLQAAVLRLDAIHPLISGNKWFKLRFYLEEANAMGKKTLVTFGGAWSNHILATAAAAKLNGFQSAGIIRGEAPRQPSPVLKQAAQMGMKLVFISRDDYRDKKIPVALQTDESYLIGEGGYGEKGAAGAATILDYCNKEAYTHICCAAGTGTMAAGLLHSALLSQKILAVSVLKNDSGLENRIRELVPFADNNLTIIQDYHFGGYAKYDSTLLDFMNEFYRLTHIPSDFVYTAKMFYAVTDLASQDFFLAGSKILLVHSGGLTGNESLPKGSLIF